MPDKKEEKIDRNDPRLYRVGDRFNIWHGVEQEIHGCVLVSTDDGNMELVDLDLFEAYHICSAIISLFAGDIEERMADKKIRIITPEGRAK